MIGSLESPITSRILRSLSFLVDRLVGLKGKGMINAYHDVKITCEIYM